MLASLWLPWYELRLPDAIREAFRSFGADATLGASSSGQGNPFSGLLQGLAAAIPDSLEVSGWQGMEQGDVALALLASLVLLIGLGAGAILGPSVHIDAGVAGRLMALMGAASLAVAGYHVVTRPGDDFPGADDYIDIRHGVWVALVGSALIIAGGLIGASAQQAAPRDAWNTGAPAGGQDQPAAGGTASEGWIAPTASAPQRAEAPGGDIAPTPIYIAAPTTSTAPPGFTP